MSDAPPLGDGERIVHDHMPSLRAFKRTALIMLLCTLPVVIAFAFVFPDTLWPSVPLFITCFLLMQERFGLGRYRAWITNRRIVLQGGQSVDLSDIKVVAVKANGVRVDITGGGKAVKLSYPEDGPALVQVITDAEKGTT